MNLKILDLAVCRTPVFGLNDTYQQRYKALLALIAESAPDFAARIKQDHHTFNDKNFAYTVWKYFNRAKYRATPYGGFAAITIIPLISGVKMLKVTSGIIPYEFYAWEEKDDCAKQEKPTAFQINPTAYRVGEELRYIHSTNGIFEIASLPFSAEIAAVMAICLEKQTDVHIRSALKSILGLTSRSQNKLLDRLIEIGVLISDRYPNIIGQDYFTRLGYKSANQIQRYKIGARSVISGGLDKAGMAQLTSLIVLLGKILPVTKNTNLVNFKQAFVAKFDQRAIPLGLAMDPEVGIGYGSLGCGSNNMELTDIFDRHKAARDWKMDYSAFHHFILQQLIAGTTIRLEDYVESEPQNHPHLPNTLSVMLRYCDSHIVIDHIGGATANALLGRFSIADCEMLALCRQITALEEAANPGVAFFDVGYQAEQQIDDINRRARIYRYELPILTWSCDAIPLNLDDILVSVHQNEVVLWSKKLNKRLVPRLASAYNYQRSDLALYRFLCDLQHQDISTDLNVKPIAYFPDLSFYPRMVFRDIILSAAAWRFPAEFLKGADDPTAYRFIEKWLVSNQIDFKFKCGHSDQTLCFDPGQVADIASFLTFCRRHDYLPFYITEALIEQSNLVTDENGNSYAGQFLISVTHDARVYAPHQPVSSQQENVPQRRFLPGSKWLYLEIYCHPIRSDQLLLGQISEFLKIHGSLFNDYFFIRYQDPKSHIRLRLHLKSPESSGILLLRINQLLAPLAESGVVSDLQVKTYDRELERYDCRHILAVEKLFALDSTLVLEILRGGQDNARLQVCALATFKRVMKRCLGTPDEQLEFVGLLTGWFREEFSFNHQHFKKINTSFRRLNVSYQFTKKESVLVEKYAAVAGDLLRKTKDNTVKFKYLADFFHMHINRLFKEDQRQHEALIYQYLSIELRRLRALYPSGHLPEW